MPMDKMSYGAGAANTHGKGGTMAAAKKNPNKTVSLNSTPCGPYAHFLSEGEDYSGIELREAIKERAHKVKSKARARMKEAAGAEEAEASAKAAPAAKEAPAADAAPKTGADAAPDEKPAS